MLRVIIVLGSLTFVTAAPGVLIGVIGDNQAPPASIGPFSLRAFDPDTRPITLAIDTASLPTPFGGEITFEPSLSHRRALGGGWGRWAHGYAGDVYFSYSPTVTIDLGEALGGSGPPAFLFYADTSRDTSSIMVVGTSDVGETVTLGPISPPSPSGGTARWFAFYTIGPDVMSSIMISSTDPDGFAIGEFHIAIPEPSAILTLSALVFLRFRREENL